MSVYDQFSNVELSKTTCGLCGWLVWVDRDGDQVVDLPCTNPDCPRYEKDTEPA
jgi:hypothetical protein